MKLSREQGRILKLSHDQGRTLKHKPVFDSLFGEYPAEEILDPLESLTDTGDVELNAKNEVDTVLDAIVSEKKQRRDAYRAMVDLDYWVCVCFQSRDQKDEFLREARWEDLGDKYIDGLKVAERMNIRVAAIDVPHKKTRKVSNLLRKAVIEQ